MRSQIMRLLLLAALLFGLLVPMTLGQTDPGTTPTTTTTGPPPVTVVSKSIIRPKRHVTIKVHFHPWATPSVSEVTGIIIPVEARGSSYVESTLYRRIRCESHYQWWAVNGQYHGLGQFAYSTFTRGLTTLRTHRVRYISTRIHHRRVMIVKHMSDGTVKRHHGWKERQYVRVIHTGRIPRHPAWTHGWAQVRIMAQAIRGQSAVHDSEWQCR